MVRLNQALPYNGFSEPDTLVFGAGARFFCVNVGGMAIAAFPMIHNYIRIICNLIPVGCLMQAIETT